MEGSVLWRSARRSALWRRKLRLRVAHNRAPASARHSRKWNPRRAGYLSHILVVGTDLASRRRKLPNRMSLHFEASEHAMHVAARADSLHDLLPDVAALGEIQRVLLSGLLRQIAFAKINSKARYPSDDAIEFEGIAAGGRGAGRDQGVPD